MFEITDATGVKVRDSESFEIEYKDPNPIFEAFTFIKVKVNLIQGIFLIKKNLFFNYFAKVGTKVRDTEQKTVQGTK